VHTYPHTFLEIAKIRRGGEGMAREARVMVVVVVTVEEVEVVVVVVEEEETAEKMIAALEVRLGVRSGAR
jgi:hypothetical protein